MLTTKSLPSVQLTDPRLQLFQNSVAAALTPVLTTPILDGVLLTNLVISASGKLVAAHGLGRPAQGIIVVDASAAVPIPYRLAADQTSPDGAAVLTFSSGAGATVSLWVF